MKVHSIAPFVPSGSDFQASKQFFQALGFELTSDQHGYAGFQKDGCAFILQDFNDKAFAENLMLSVRIDDVAGFREEVLQKKLPEKFGIRISDIRQQPYGKEVNIIDRAGVCWHFIQ
ncbi:MAG TPA: hypothetical protein VL307_02605 [Chitinophagaceae bacterium]|nr:hypothetical protein [Chitinophagaceae bacterium]